LGEEGKEKMIFKIEEKKDKILEEMYKKAMKELNEFYELNWEYNLPNVIILESREELNNFWGEKTEDWLVAFAEKQTTFILSRENYEKESSHKYSYEEYFSILKHELGHLFFGHLSNKKDYPYWLNEGTQLFIANQLKSKKAINQFSNFINHYNKWEKSVYQESGFAVEFLVTKFGKSKLINLIKGLSQIESEEEFNRLFKKIYGFELTYDEINKRYKK
jgi:hypothetical protein